MKFKSIMKDALVIFALGITLTFSSCEKGTPNNEITPSVTLGTENISTTPVSLSAADKSSPYQVAPIFEHGKGISAYDGKSIETPYYFTEEEAFQVISEEALSYGNITLTKENTPIWKTVKLPVTDLRDDANKKKKEKKVHEIGNLKTSGWDEKNSIVIKFISKDDMEQWADHGKDAKSKEYEFLATALRLQETLAKKKAKWNFGIFYDPCSSYQTSVQFNRLKDIYLDEDDLSWKTLQKELLNNQKMKYEEYLRSQVRAFIDWLRTENLL